jgi:GntR family transcriptional regulator, transcriptional repressor for pyruvate dehydrogenase complex
MDPEQSQARPQHGRPRPRLQPVRVAESIAAELRHRIVRGAFADGRLLPKQDELVAEFGVSYPSVREALRILEAEGLITVRRGNVGGAEVHRPDATSAGYALGLALAAARVPLSDVGEALLVLEPLCASICARASNRQQEIVPKLMENIRAAEQAIDDGILFTSTSREFHNLLVVSVPNETLRLVVRSLVSLWSVQELAWAELLASEGEYFSMAERRESLRAHSAIAAHIEEGDDVAAGHSSLSHLAATQSVFSKRFSDAIIDVTSMKARVGRQAFSPNGSGI